MSVGFMSLSRVTWDSPSSLLQKISGIALLSDYPQSFYLALSVRLYLLSSVIIVGLKSRILDTSFLSLVPTRVSDPYADGSACFCPVRIQAKREREGMNKS